MLRIVCEKTEQFLKAVYSSIIKRSDSYLEMGLALASSSHIESVVSLSESPLYRRKFSSIYETLSEVEWNGRGSLLKAELELFKERCENLKGMKSIVATAHLSNAMKRTPLARVMKRFSHGELA